jgi:hypothetical protein
MMHRTYFIFLRINERLSISKVEYLMFLPMLYLTEISLRDCGPCTQLVRCPMIRSPNFFNQNSRAPLRLSPKLSIHSLRCMSRKRDPYCRLWIS